MNKPNPGSVEARALGCSCPLIDNGYSKGAYANENGDPAWWIAHECPLHGTGGSGMLPRDPATIDMFGANDVR
jgi:hypothetical protein